MNCLFVVSETPGCTLFLKLRLLKNCKEKVKEMDGLPYTSSSGDSLSCKNKFFVLIVCFVTLGVVCV